MNDARMKLARFGFKRLPFTYEILEPYIDPRREKHLKLLKEFLQLRGFAVISGPPGTGKTVLIKHLCSQLPANTHKVVYIPFSTLSDSDMLKTMCLHLGIESTMSRSKMFKGIQEHVERMQPVNPVIVFDEAQKLSHKTLETIRLLANFEFDGRHYISIVMAGTEDFTQIFRLRINQSLLQRISLFCSITPLSRDLTREYVAHHFKAAGAEREIVTAQAINLVFDAASGIPRVINNMMFAGLREAAEDEADLVDLEHVRKGMMNFHMPELMEGRK